MNRVFTWRWVTLFILRNKLGTGIFGVYYIAICYGGPHENRFPYFLGLVVAPQSYGGGFCAKDPYNLMG